MDSSQTDEPSVKCPICGSTDFVLLDKVIGLPTHRTVQCQCGAVFTYRVPKPNDKKPPSASGC